MKNKEITVVEEESFLKMFPGASLLFSYFPNKILIEKEVDRGNEYYWLTLETRYDRKYVIRVNETDKGYTYFGAWADCRLIRPFEDWVRGNDFTEGELGGVTIKRFLADVINDLFVNVPKEEWKMVEQNND